MAKQRSELVYLPLGGAGEIGMNLYLYGFGPRHRRQWLVVDFGVTFPGEYEPGVDLIFPDTRFIEEERQNIVGIVLTHAHEDHFGAVIDLWPRLGAKVYATPFTAALLRAKLIEEGREGTVPIEEIPLKARFTLGPFDIELVTVAHSIPEPNALVIRTELGTVVHTGDWKLDPDPIAGQPTDAERLKAVGEEGVATLICDSTNAFRDGVSPSEADVAESLARVIAETRHRVAVTTFASNVARLRSVMEGAYSARREVIVVGRAMQRIIQVARETGYLPEHYAILGDDHYDRLPRNKVAALCTGSQGEPRGAIARIAVNDHPRVKFAAGDRAIFSSRTIPGNDKAVTRVQNHLADLGVEVITDAEALVHVSGHPRRAELEQMYAWTKPQAVIPMHGESRHLLEHARLARDNGIGHALPVHNGSIVRLLPGLAEVIDEAPVGRLYKDGHLILDPEDGAIAQRRKLSYVGTVSVSVVLTRKGDVAADPIVSIIGLPLTDGAGTPMGDIAVDAAYGALDGIPRPRRKDRDMVGEAVRRAVRAAIGQAWGKRPLCSVLVTVV